MCVLGPWPKSAQRTHVDDMTSLARHHAPRRLLAAEKGGLQIHRMNEIPISLRDIESLNFAYFNLLNTATTSLVEVKQVQLSLRMVRLVALARTSEYVISAQFTMRAKSTSN